MFGLSKKSIVIGAPMDGYVMPASRLKDPVFRENALGCGIAIKPVSGCVRAPAKAVVCQMLEKGNAFNLYTDSGVELLIHVGYDTDGFSESYCTVYKDDEESVELGDILMEFDADAISAEGYDAITPVVVRNPYDFREIAFVPEGYVKTGDPLITIRM